MELSVGNDRSDALLRVEKYSIIECQDKSTCPSTSSHPLFFPLVSLHSRDVESRLTFERPRFDVRVTFTTLISKLPETVVEQPLGGGEEGAIPVGTPP